MKSNGKFTYTRYDYSFLRPKPSFWESKVLPIAERVYAKTIGEDLTTVQPMNEPVGQLYWADAVYEPVRDTNRGWEVTFTTPATTAVTTDYSNVDITIDDLTNKITDVSNQIQTESNRGNANYTVTGSNVSSIIWNTQGTAASITYIPKHFGKSAADFMIANREAKKRLKDVSHSRRLNLIRKINKIRHGKKI